MVRPLLSLLCLAPAVIAQDRWITSPVNGHSYRLTSAVQTWHGARAEALALLGDLCTLRSAAEHDWVWETFGRGRESLWIGLTDEGHEGQWAWSSGDGATWRHWATRQPDGLPTENWALLYLPDDGAWHDAPSGGTFVFRGVIEIESYATFGAGCGGAGGPVTLTPILPPQLGRAFSLLIANVPSGQPGIFFPMGLSRVQWNGVPLPLTLEYFGMPGCTLYTDAVIPPLPLAPTPFGAIVWGTQLPNDRQLLGARFFNQAFFADPSANAAGLVASNAGAGAILR